MPRQVLDVGQCDLDHGNISRMLEERFGANVDRAHTLDEAVRAAGAKRYDLVLVNRLLDRDASVGLDVVRRFKAEQQLRDVPVMLVSNYADAQDGAVEAGAVRGFGKNDLASEATTDLLAPHLTAPAGDRS